MKEISDITTEDKTVKDYIDSSRWPVSVKLEEFIEETPINKDVKIRVYKAVVDRYSGGFASALDGKKCIKGLFYEKKDMDKFNTFLEMTLPEKQKYLHKTFLKFRTNLGPITGEETVSKQ